MTFKTISIGCKVNSYECNAIAELLKQEDFTLDESNPDIVIINTCSVTATADQKSRQHIRKISSLHPNALIVVMGCYSQKNYQFIFDNTNAHIILGTSFRNEIPTLIKQYISTKERIVKVNNKTREYCYEELGQTTYSENVRAYVKVQDGCDNFCSYCLIPYVRGKSRSRKQEDIINEINSLVDNNFKEIVLTGIHVGGYGKEFNNSSFSSLVDKITQNNKLYRLRISSIEESEIDTNLIKLISTRNNIASHLHIPLQSGCDETLKRMHRKYTCKDFLEKINLIKLNNPNIALTTDVIVGFPGETEEEFNNTFKFIKECGFNMLHVFPFSAREGTLAYSMKNQVDPKVKKDRVNKLITLSNELWNTYTSTFIDKEVEVLIERYSKEDRCNIGHTSNYIEVKIPSETDKTGEIIEILLKKDMIIS